MKSILNKYGILRENHIQHKIYNRMKGIAEWKKNNNDKNDTIKEEIKEYLYLLDTRKIK